MKLCNFASLDPAMQGKGLKGASKADAEIISEFLLNSEQMILASEAAYNETLHTDRTTDISESTAKPFLYDFEKLEEAERVSQIKIRTVQHFFRKAVISSYHNKCSICSLNHTELLIASHIVPWSKKIESRADPANGISLCSLHDKAFDLGFIGIDSHYKILVSSSMQGKKIQTYDDMFLMFDNQQIHMPFRFSPNAEYLNWHHQNVFRK
ncbi:putative restriction endonuclease [Nitrosomonas aestuarii]|uniref:Putative restriction endonuclease n=1 Tax=Nitrosomonas aestuarii TaxID=52441 RepID=A0A1I4EZM8_9PROT|nr:HNH endonuclease [Nitrosomonas aestuarii]SFL10006.1 putative restriction endonuclease [Nitrosomonas aestuarii]